MLCQAWVQGPQTLATSGPRQDTADEGGWGRGRRRRRRGRQPGVRGTQRTGKPWSFNFTPAHGSLGKMRVSYFQGFQEKNPDILCEICVFFLI